MQIEGEYDNFYLMAIVDLIPFSRYVPGLDLDLDFDLDLHNCMVKVKI